MKVFNFGLYILLLLIVLCVGCGQKKVEPVAESVPAQKRTLEDYKNKKIGVLNGTLYDSKLYDKFPHASISYFNSVADMIMALKTKKIDAIATDEASAISIGRYDPKMISLNETIDYFANAFIFSKDADGEKLRDEFNEFWEEFAKSGEGQELYDLWLEEEPETDVPYYDELPGENGTLTMAVCAEFEPYVFVKDGKIVGYEMDVATEFCRSRGYALIVSNMNFDAMMSAVSTSKYDFAGTSISITDERKKSVYFSSPLYITTGQLVILDEAEQVVREEKHTVMDSFENTFVVEERYKLFGVGILCTLCISLMSVVIGTICGFLMYLVYHKRYSKVNKAMELFIWIIQGTPMIVLLMILYYLLLGEIAVSGLLVSIVGFSLSFSCSVVSMLIDGVNAVSKGQIEAALALGFSEKDTFYSIVLPQAVKRIIPNYSNEICSVIKGTSVVGYIAVQDLTKIGDVIRARTYEAFFPLIAVAVIYFVMAELFVLVVKGINRFINTRMHGKEHILKGVVTHDRAETP